MKFRNCEPQKRKVAKEGKDKKRGSLKKKSVQLTKKEQSNADKSKVQMLLHLYEIINIL